MPDYRYRAINQSGRIIRGAVFAANEQDLNGLIESSGLDLIEFKKINEQRLSKLFQPRVKVRDLIQMSVHLEQLQRAGVPLMESLGEVRDSTDTPRLRDALAQITREVNDGFSLSTAFASHPKLFGNVFQSLVAAGEQTGQMAEAFSQLVAHLKWTDEMSVKVKKATRYPAILAVVVTGVVMFMMSFVVPQITSLLQANGAELPFMTQALVSTSNAIRDYWFLIPVLAIGSVIGVTSGRAMSQEFKYRTDYYLLRLPVIGIVLRKIGLARFAYMFSTMFRSGIALLECLDASKRLVNNLVLAEALSIVREGVQSGVGLSMAMRSSGEFPPLVLRMIKVGEDSGNMSDALNNVAEMYNRDVDESVQGMISFIEPALTVVMGGIMAWIAIAVFGPVYDSLGKF
ncbi:MAG: type II secretion system F family protein [Alphaproteobacteria bacterium]|nr:type II secretion system F family protein [Alphaproteobacteria bacterium]